MVPGQHVAGPIRQHPSAGDRAAESFAISGSNAVNRRGRLGGLASFAGATAGAKSTRLDVFIPTESEFCC